MTGKSEEREREREMVGSLLAQRFKPQRILLLPRNHWQRVQFGLVIEISFGETPADALGPTTPAFGERCTVASPTLLTTSMCKFLWGREFVREKKKKERVNI